MLRAVLGLFLALLLSLTSVTAAVARGQMAGATEMVLCAGTAVERITLDATGAPVVAHHCPVCTAASHGGPLPDAPSVLRPVLRVESALIADVAVLRAVGAVASVARGPPVRV